MSVEMITAVGGGLSTVLGALAVLLTNRTRRIAEDSRYLRRQVRTLQRKLLAATDLIWEYEQITPPHRRLARPEILEQDDDDDGPAPQPAGAHAAP